MAGEWGINPYQKGQSSMKCFHQIEGQLTQLAWSKGIGKYIELPRGEGATRFKVQGRGRELRLEAEREARRVCCE